MPDHYFTAVAFNGGHLDGHIRNFPEGQLLLMIDGYCEVFDGQVYRFDGATVDGDTAIMQYLPPESS